MWSTLGGLVAGGEAVRRQRETLARLTEAIRLQNLGLARLHMAVSLSGAGA